MKKGRNESIGQSALVAWVGEHPLKSTREENAEILSQLKCKARAVVRRGEESLLTVVNPNTSQYQEGGEERRAKIRIITN